MFSHEKLFQHACFGPNLTIAVLFQAVTEFYRKNNPKIKVSHERFFNPQKKSHEKK